MPNPSFILFALLTVLGWATAAAASSDPGATSLQFRPCQIQDLAGISVYSADCTELTVAENPANPGGRKIKLHIARVPAINRRKSEDPLFLLAGGPGMSATDLYGNAAGAFGRIRRDRDIVLVDQRGTGSSNPLNCEIDDIELMQATDAQLAEETKRCLDSLSARADVAYYTTSIAVQDLDRVRQALGYERINLYGGSYGTRVAEHYLRKFPQHTRTVILDGIIAPEQVVGPDTALDAEKALLAVLARCAREPACKEKFGDPAETYRALLAKLDAKPVPVTFADPTSGSPMTLEFGRLHLATVLRLSIYNSEQAALLPLALHLAQTAGNFGPLAGQFMLTVRKFGDIAAFGMHNSVICTEDVPRYDSVKIDRAKVEATFMGAAQIDGLKAICALWPRGPLDADLHAPLRSNVPVLLLSGGNDPVTPAANGDLLKAGLSESVHLVLPDLGHGQIGAPCMEGVMATFVRLGTVKGLDTSCVKRAKPAPFFTTLSGPTP